MAARTWEQWIEIHKCRLSDGAASGESLQRFMKIAWDAAIAENAEALKPSHNSQSTPLCACGQPAVKVLCDNCFCDEVFAATKKRA